MPKLTPAMRKALEAARDGNLCRRESLRTFKFRYYGGTASTFEALMVRGLIEPSSKLEFMCKTFVLTPAGRAALEGGNAG